MKGSYIGMVSQNASPFRNIEVGSDPKASVLVVKPEKGCGEVLKTLPHLPIS